MAEVRILYIATSSGLVQLANPGKSDRWREIGRALDGQKVSSVAASPDDPLLAYAAGWAGIERSTNGGAGWERVYERPVTALAFGADGQIVAGTEAGELLTSADGHDWRKLADAGATVTQLMALTGTRFVTVGADGSVGEFDGQQWRARDVDLPDARGVASDHQATEALFVAGTSTLATQYGVAALPDEATGALLNLLGTPPTLLIGTRAALLRSQDNAATIEPVAGPHNVTALVSPQRAVDQAFAGTAAGELWYSADRGRSWSSLASDLTAVHSLAFARAL